MLYGSDLYGNNIYANQVEDGNCTCKSLDLISLLPSLYHKPVFKEILDIIGCQLYTQRITAKEIELQGNIDTATWGLIIWEQELGLDGRGLDYDSRREIIKAKLRGRGRTTVAMIKNMAESFSGGEVQIIEHFEEYYSTVKFVGVIGIPKNMKAFVEAIERIKPAHINYKFEYTYTVWGHLEHLNWGELEGSTWGEVAASDYVNKEVIA